VRVDIYVRPGASAAAVGGVYDGALVVRVVEPAHAGRATEAALQAMAEALEVPRRSVSLVRGGKSRRKLIDIEAGSEGAAALTRSLARLCDSSGGGR
jgi:uncharacterized protein YggU (UPF0235/DUF167 family)